MLRVVDGSLAGAERQAIRQEFRFPLRVEGGAVGLFDCEALMGGGPTELDPRYGAAVPCTPGDWNVHVTHVCVAPGPDAAADLFRDSLRPSLFVRFVPAAADAGLALTEEHPDPMRLTDHQDGFLTRLPGHKVRAHVRRVEEDCVTMELMLTEVTASGYGRMPPPEGVTLRSGQ
jgi:hypothetical protein